MSKFTKELVDDYAKKLYISLTKEENDLVLKEFDLIEKEMNLIADYPGLESVEPMVHTLDDFVYELRSDDEVFNEDVNNLLSNCDSYEDLEIKIPKVVG